MAFFSPQSSTNASSFATTMANFADRREASTLRDQVTAAAQDVLQMLGGLSDEEKTNSDVMSKVLQALQSKGYPAPVVMAAVKTAMAVGRDMFEGQSRVNANKTTKTLANLTEARRTGNVDAIANYTDKLKTNSPATYLTDVQTQSANKTAASKAHLDKLNILSQIKERETPPPLNASNKDQLEYATSVINNRINEINGYVSKATGVIWPTETVPGMAGSPNSYRIHIPLSPKDAKISDIKEFRTMLKSMGLKTFGKSKQEKVNGNEGHWFKVGADPVAVRLMALKMANPNVAKIVGDNPSDTPATLTPKDSAKKLALIQAQSEAPKEALPSHVVNTPVKQTPIDTSSIPASAGGAIPSSIRPTVNAQAPTSTSGIPAFAGGTVPTDAGTIPTNAPAPTMTVDGITIQDLTDPVPASIKAKSVLDKFHSSGIPTGPATQQNNPISSETIPGGALDNILKGNTASQPGQQQLSPKIQAAVQSTAEELKKGGMAIIQNWLRKLIAKEESGEPLNTKDQIIKLAIAQIAQERSQAVQA